MLLRYRIQLVFAIAAMVLFSACTKTNTQGKLIPKDAAFVLHINGESLAAKLPWDDVKNNTMFQKMYADSSMPAFAKAVFDNPDNSGVDIKKDMIVYAQKDATGGTIVFTGAIKDAEKFRLFNLEGSKGGAESKDGDNNFITKAPVSVGWNKEKFVYLVDAPQLNREAMNKRYMDTAPPLVQGRDVLAACKAVFAMKPGNSLAEDEKFSDLVKKEGDLHFWLNVQELQKGSGINEAMEMPIMKLENLYEGLITTAAVNFTDGKITAEVKNYAGKELAKLYKKYNGGSINEDMLKRLPLKNAAAVFALNFKPQGIVELLKLAGMDGMVNIGLAFMGFTLDDFVKANKGDLVIAIPDFKTVTDSASYKLNGKEKVMAHTRTKPDILFAASIDDKSSFDKLIRAGEKLSTEKDMDMPATYKSNDKYFVIGSSKDNVDKYINGGSDTKLDFLDNLGNGPMAGYIDIQFILKAMESEVMKDSSEIEIYNASLGMWNNVYIKGGDYSDGGIAQTIEINLVDKNTNSLKQLNSYFGKIALVLESKEKDRTKSIDMPVLPSVTDTNIVQKAKKRPARKPLK